MDEYGIRTIIDLRTKYSLFPHCNLSISGPDRPCVRSEHLKQAQKKSAGLHSTAINSQSNDVIAETLTVPGIRYHQVNLNGGAFERALLWKLSWSSLTRLLALMAWGRRSEAIAILGREVMQPRGLVGLGRDSIDHCWVELREVLQILAEALDYPVMIHCTQGKDRTGLVVILLLLMFDIPLNAITSDYMASEAELRSDKPARLQDIAELGLSEEFAGTPSDFVTQISQHLDNRYDGLLLYLQRVGLRTDLREKIKSMCLQL